MLTKRKLFVVPGSNVTLVQYLEAVFELSVWQSIWVVVVKESALVPAHETLCSPHVEHMIIEPGMVHITTDWDYLKHNTYYTIHIYTIHNIYTQYIYTKYIYTIHIYIIHIHNTYTQYIYTIHLNNLASLVLSKYISMLRIR